MKVLQKSVKVPHRSYHPRSYKTRFHLFRNNFDPRRHPKCCIIFEFRAGRRGRGRRNLFRVKIIPSFSTCSFAIISNASLNEAFPSWNTSTNETYAITPDADAKQKHEHCLNFLKIRNYRWPLKLQFKPGTHVPTGWSWNLLFVNWIKYSECSNKCHKPCCGCQRKTSQRLYRFFIRQPIRVNFTQ